MTTIRVSTGKSYDVTIGRGILSDCGKMVKALPNTYDKLAIITDDKVDSLYSKTVADSLMAAGFSCVKFVFQNGEASKSLAVLEQACDFLCEQFITRKSLIVALGGGVTGDLAGFLAAIFQRGIDFVQIPTTFLAAIDSSVGGKTAVNVPAGKNLLGAFWQPQLCWCDIETLATLDEEVFRDGVAEAVKYGCILDKNLFETMKQGVRAQLAEIITRCVELKAEVVAQDERDNGLRAILNFGHTLGHGIETLSDFAISHGKAVAIGMVLASKAGEAAGVTEAGTTAQIEEILQANGISTICPYDIADVVAASLGDKKRDGDTMHLILLKRIGEAVVYPVAVDKLMAFFAGE